MSDLDESGCLVTESGKKIPRLELTPQMIVDQSFVVYGPTKTGKTRIVKHLMATVDGYIEQIIVVSPSEPTNRSYEDVVDSPLIHYRLFLPNPSNPSKDDGTKGSLRFLEAVWKRQEMMAAIYTRANKMDVLAQLYGRLPKEARAEGLRFIRIINHKREYVARQVRSRYASDPGKRDEKVREINEKFRKMLLLLYKKYISLSYENLWESEDLSEDELYSLCYLDFNPRLLLVLDDCAAALKPLFGKEIFRSLFYQNRHCFITIVICCQDDTDLPTNLRKNAFVSFFTEPVVCSSNFDRLSNRFSKSIKNSVPEISSAVFKGYRKLAYIREDDRGHHFYHIQCPYHKPTRFGSRALHELCDSVKSDGVTMDKENPFYDKFKLEE